MHGGNRIRRWLGAGSAFFLAASIALPAAGQDGGLAELWAAVFPAAWPMAGQNPQRTGISPYPGCTTGEREWGSGASNQGVEAIVLGSDAIYTRDFTAHLNATEFDGRLRWRTPADAVAPAVGPDGVIYASIGGQLTAVDPNRAGVWVNAADQLVGDFVRWRLPIGMQSPPILGADGNLYLSGLSGGASAAYAVDPSGAVKWRIPVASSMYAGPALSPDGATAYVGAGDGNLYALRAADGSQRWKLSFKSEITGVSVGSNGTVYVGTTDANLRAVAAAGRVTWTAALVKTTKGIPYHGTVPAVDEARQTVYVGGKDGLHAFNAANGAKRWFFPTHGGPSARGHLAVSSDGTVHLTAFYGTHSAVSPNGTLLWSAGVNGPGCNPVIGGDGTVYAAGRGLYAFRNAGAARPNIFRLAVGHYRADGTAEAVAESVVAGETMILSADGVYGGNGTLNAVSKVEYYLDDGDGAISPSDVPLGADTDPTQLAWRIDVDTAPFEPGAYTFLVVATDEATGTTSTVTSATVLIMPAP